MVGMGWVGQERQRDGGRRDLVRSSVDTHSDSPVAPGARMGATDDDGDTPTQLNAPESVNGEMAVLVGNQTGGERAGRCSQGGAGASSLAWRISRAGWKS